MKGGTNRTSTRVATKVGHILHALDHVDCSLAMLQARAVEDLKGVSQICHGCGELFDVCKTLV